MLNRRILKLAVATVTIASALGLASPGTAPASAATAPRPATATAAHAAPGTLAAGQPAGAHAAGAGPDSAGPHSTCNPSNAWAVLTGSEGNWAAICGGPDVFNVAPYRPFTELTIRVKNRVWLHQTYPLQGWADCFSVSNPPKTFILGGRDQNPGDMQVSANTSPC